MMLIKEIAVYVNILNSRIKKCFFDKLQKNKINITPEQFLVLDILWEKQSLSQQNIADIIQKFGDENHRFVGEKAIGEACHGSERPPCQ